jgi:uncharacterized cupin superfamily protein
MTYILDGEIIVNVDGTESRVGPGGMSFVPKGVPHAFLVVSNSARLLTLHSPGATSQAFYRGASEPATDDTSEIVDIARLQTSAKENPPRNRAPRAAAIRERQGRLTSSPISWKALGRAR